LASADKKNLSLSSLVALMKQGKGFSGIFHYFISSFYDKVFDKVGILPGSEFKAAFEEARRIGAKVVLGDRPVQISFFFFFSPFCFVLFLDFCFGT
jgi:pheromone shutdown protein TraB